MRYDKAYGVGLKAGTLRDLLESSYSGQDVDGFIIDNELSSDFAKVYYNPTTDKAVVAHRGTSGASDWANNAVFGVGGKDAYRYTERYKASEASQIGARDKYGKENITTIGHSQGGLLAELFGDQGRETITVNKATRPQQSLFGLGKKGKNQYDVRSTGDAVSYFRNPYKKKNRRDVDIKAKTMDPLVEHSYDILNRIDPETVIGDKVIGGGRCWAGFEPVVGKKPFSKGSCKKIGEGLSQRAKSQAKKLGVKIKESDKKHKKIDILNTEGEVLHSVGDSRYPDYESLLKSKGREFANKRRELYKKRHNKTRHVPGTASFYADQILW
jgi:hypothetical protein